MQLELQQLLNGRLSDVRQILWASSQKLSEVTFPTLVQELDQNGVYVFGMYVEDGWTPTYVGVACSRLFFERLAGHFDTRDGAFMNSMLKHLQRKEAVEGRPPVSLRELAATVAQSGTLVTINYPDAKGSRMLERVLRHRIPVLNAGKKSGYDAETDWVQLGGKV